MGGDVDNMRGEHARYGVVTGCGMTRIEPDIQAARAMLDLFFLRPRGRHSKDLEARAAPRSSRMWMRP